MFRNYLIISFRKAIRDGLYSAINILGLALGIAAFLFITKFVSKEMNMDQFHSDPDRIFRMYTDWKWNSFEGQFPGTPPALGTAMIDNFEEVEYLTRIRSYNEIQVMQGEDLYIEQNTLAVDSNFLKIFNFKFIEGNSNTAFTKINTVVLPEAYATKYFGDDLALGKLLTINVGGKESAYEVVGVIEDAPLNSHINYGLMIPILQDGQVEYMEWSWVWSNLATYVKIYENADPVVVENKLPELVKNNAGYAISRITGNTLETFFKNGNRIGYTMQPLSEVYYDGQNNIGPVGNKIYIYVFAGIAGLILLLACINYMNLTTARSIKRMREVGIRKVIGSSRGQLLIQFLIESLIYSLCATVLAVFIGEILNETLAQTFGLRWNLSPLADFTSIATVIGISVFVGLLAGLYPAIFLSSFRPAYSLKGIHSQGESKSLLRNSLVVFQFVISFGIIIMAFTVNSQIDFLRNRDIGFDKERLLIVNNVHFLDNLDVFKNEILGLSSVKSSTYSNVIPGNGGNFEIFKKVGDADQDYVMLLINTDVDFVKTFGLQIIEGKNYTEQDINADQPKTLINTVAAKAFEFDDAIGSKMIGLDNGRELEVSGVVQDFDFSMSRREYPSIVIRPYRTEGDGDASFTNFLTIKLESEDLMSTVKQVEKIWLNQGTSSPFQYSFFNQIFDQNYRSENRLSGLLSIFSGIAIVIGLLGLIGLISYNTEQLKKSIGIRKVFGASVNSVMFLLTKDFIRLLIIAFAITIPVVNYFIKDWLKEFIYKIDVQAGLFVIPGCLILFIALATIWGQSYRAARTNPAQVIRNE